MKKDTIRIFTFFHKCRVYYFSIPKPELGNENEEDIPFSFQASARELGR